MCNCQDPDRRPLATPDEPSRKSVDGCCGGSAPAGTGACCALDAKVKSVGGAGCGCATNVVLA